MRVSNPLPLAVLLATLLPGGCDETPDPMGQRPALPAPIQRRVDEAVEELDPPPSPSWPTEVRGLRESADAFTSVEACLAELRARTPVAVAEGIADLAYDGFFDDVCRGLEAVKAGDPDRCDALDASTVRAGCRRRVAILNGLPAACPADMVLPGRDSVCVAWAARDRELCRAASIADRARCAAVLDGEARGCVSLRGGDRGRCEAEVRRYAGALGEERHESAAAARPAVLELTVTVEGASGDPIRIERDVLARGVRLVPQGCRYQVALGEPHGEGMLPSGPGRFEPTFHLELAVPMGDDANRALPLGATDAVLSLALPAHGGITSIAGASGQVALSAFEPRVGGAVDGTVRGRLRSGGAELAVEGRFRTFVRDLEPLAEHCTHEAGGRGGGTE